MSVSNHPTKTPSSDPKPVRPRQRSDLFQQALRLPIVIWQGLFFIAPLFFLVAMSFFIVRNYRMT
ncbi:MAG: ABC transporter permease, partial [Candidatus Puniceispirillaceae bacterium]